MLAWMRVGICEHEVRLQEILARALAGERFEVLVAGNDEEALGAFTEMVPDLLIIDIRPRNLNARELRRALRDRGVDAPALFLARRERLDDQLTGVKGGDDDFVTAPFSLPEIMVRVRSLVDRHH